MENLFTNMYSNKPKRNVSVVSKKKVSVVSNHNNKTAKRNMNQNNKSVAKIEAIRQKNKERFVKVTKDLIKGNENARANKFNKLIENANKTNSETMKKLAAELQKRLQAATEKAKMKRKIYAAFHSDKYQNNKVKKQATNVLVVTMKNNKETNKQTNKQTNKPKKMI